MKGPGFTDDHIVLNSLLHDLHHAYEGRALERTFDEGDELRKVTYFGTPILWPMFIFAVGFYRWGLGFVDSTKSQQSDAYRLEDIAHSLLVEANPATGLKCIDWLQSFAGVHKEYAMQFFDESTYRYIFFSQEAETRFANLPNILRMTFPLSLEYQAFEKNLKTKAAGKCCSLHELKSLADWPQFDW